MKTCDTCGYDSGRANTCKSCKRKEMEREYEALNAEFAALPDSFRKGKRYERMCSLYLKLSGIKPSEVQKGAVEKFEELKKVAQAQEKEAEARWAGEEAAHRVEVEHSTRDEKPSPEETTRQAKKVYDLAYNAVLKGTAKKLSDFKVGDVVLLTSKMKTGEDTRSARIDAVDYLGRGYVLYSGWGWRKDITDPWTLSSGSGAFYPDQIGGAPFGLQKVEVVAHDSSGPSPTWTPRPGDRAYDLMC